ncbi:MAG TPA: response regulator transcription factor [Candidatus Dormibacteraeota bacterium]|jgi:DNA-binding NarL/FixJ family response regulator
MPDPLRVLIADDHHVVRRGLAMILQVEAGVDVVGEACNGQEAVEMALRLLPDLVLLDVRMPGRDGVQAAQIIKQRAPSVRILMLTGIIPSQATMTIFQGAADGYILKDASPPELLDAMRCVAGGKPYLQPSIIRQLFGAVTPEVEQAETLLGPALTAREIDVLRLMAGGHTNREIASRLSIGEETVRTHVKHILHKLDASSRTHAVNAAIRAGLLELG